MVRECERLSQLVERVLFFVRFGQNALDYRPHVMDPVELAQAAVQAFRARFGGRSPEVPARVDSVGQGPRVQLTADGPLPAVAVDRVAMMEVLLNLLDNAHKYSPGGKSASGHPGGADIEVRVAKATRRRWFVGPKRDCVRFSVRDYGIGIPPRQRRKIFRRFYRAPGARRENVSGVGLGLALCRHVVQAHGGWIEVRSEVGQGSIFALYLPVPPSRSGRSGSAGEAAGSAVIGKGGV
jgi:signal transduction histidine kinase